MDSLIGSNAYSEFWANKFADLLQCNSENLGKKVFGYSEAGSVTSSLRTAPSISLPVNWYWPRAAPLKTQPEITSEPCAIRAR